MASAHYVISAASTPALPANETHPPMRHEKLPYDVHHSKTYSQLVAASTTLVAATTPSHAVQTTPIGMADPNSRIGTVVTTTPIPRNCWGPPVSSIAATPMTRTSLAGPVQTIRFSPNLPMNQHPSNVLKQAVSSDDDDFFTITPSVMASATPVAPAKIAPVTGLSSAGLRGPQKDIHGNMLFYQSIDSQPIFLDALTIRGLTAQYGDLRQCPQSITATVVDLVF